MSSNILEAFDTWKGGEMTRPNRGNEPAFPQESVRCLDCDQHYEPMAGGMTIREHFAAAALQGQLTNEQMQYADPAGLAANSVQLADALIAELGKGEG